MEDLRTDSENLASILINGFESSVRMFGCGKCTRSWWKKVPVRKEVQIMIYNLDCQITEIIVCNKKKVCNE